MDKSNILNLFDKPCGIPDYLLCYKVFTMNDGTLAPFTIGRYYKLQEKSTSDEAWVRNDEGISHLIYLYDRAGWIGTDYFTLES
jgi:hypothetical protein